MGKLADISVVIVHVPRDEGNRIISMCKANVREKRAKQTRACRSRKSGKKSKRWNWMSFGISLRQIKPAWTLESL